VNFDHLKPSEVKKVTVEWQDIRSISAWNEDEEDFTPLTAVCIGWILFDCETHLVIASSYDYDNEQWADYHIMPKTPPQVVFL
jgi:hypothetical protein